jgi:hypothetical protein
VNDWKGFGRKQSWPNLSAFYRISLEELRNTTKNLRIAGLRAEV